MERDNKIKEEFIQNIIKLFDEIDLDELKKDFDNAQKKDNKSEIINSFIKKYPNSNIDSETGGKILYDIISILISMKSDFLPLIKIYLTADDKANAKVLKKHFILEDKKLIKVENGDSSTYQIKFGVNLSCVDDNNIYYHKFIKGILQYLQSAFKEKYLYQYINRNYFTNLDKSSFYIENPIEYSLNKMLRDINRVLLEDSKKNMDKNVGNKMRFSKLRDLQIISGLHARQYKEISDKIKAIYEKSTNNEQIEADVNELISNISNEDISNKLLAFYIYIEEYTEKEKEKENLIELKNMIKKDKATIYYNGEYIKELKESYTRLEKEQDNLKTQLQKVSNKVEFLSKEYENMKVQIQTLSKENENIKKENENMKVQIQTLSKENENIKKENENMKVQTQTLSKENENIKKENENMKVQIQTLSLENENQNIKIKKLEEKVDFMESIILAIICRKAINYCVIKILENYKKKIKVTVETLPNNDFTYHIAFIASVNSISKDTLNNLMDDLFSKKDIYNKDSHLINKDVPTFIENLWDKIVQHLKLSKIEKDAFDAIITNEMRDGFNFGDEDKSVKNYLKSVNIDDFGN